MRGFHGYLGACLTVVGLEWKNLANAVQVWEGIRRDPRFRDYQREPVMSWVECTRELMKYIISKKRQWNTNRRGLFFCIRNPELVSISSLQRKINRVRQERIQPQENARM